MEPYRRKPRLDAGKVRTSRAFPCCERHLMKTITKTTSDGKADASLDATLNPVELSSNEIVAWAIAFPRPGFATRTPSSHTAESNVVRS